VKIIVTLLSATCMLRNFYENRRVGISFL